MASDASSQYPVPVRPTPTLTADTNPFTDRHPQTFYSPFETSSNNDQHFKEAVRGAHHVYRAQGGDPNCPVSIDKHILGNGWEIPKVTLCRATSDIPWRNVPIPIHVTSRLTVPMSVDSSTAGQSSQAAPGTVESCHALTDTKISLHTVPSTLEYGFSTGIRDVHHNADLESLDLSSEERNTYRNNLMGLRQLFPQGGVELQSEYEDFIMAPEATMAMGSFTPTAVTKYRHGGKDVDWQVTLQDNPPVLGWARHGMYQSSADGTRTRLGYADFPVYYDPSGSRFKTHIEATRKLDTSKQRFAGMSRRERERSKRGDSFF